MSVIRQATPATILAILAATKDGDTVALAAGAYPAMRWNKRAFASPIIIDATLATITDWYWTSIEGVSLKGGLFQTAAGSAFRVDNAKRLTVSAASFVGPEQSLPGQMGVAAAGYGVMINGGSAVEITDNAFTGFRTGLLLGSVDGFKANRNAFARMASDGIDIGSSRNGEVRDNVCHCTRILGVEHPDGIQLWSRPNLPPTADILIDGNVIVGETQGISAFNHIRDGVDDGGFDRITITNNMVCGGAPNGIAGASVRGLTLTGNTVRTIPGSDHRASINVTGCTGVTRTGNTVAPGAGKKADNDPA